MSTIICPSCGEESPDRFRVCPMCGTALAAIEPPREERKVVTVLFCDLVGFTSRSERLDPEEVRALQAPYWARVRSELERFGGTVEKFIGDAVMALFGAPTAHEDDPERAVRAALAIREWASETPDVQVRIGITTGEALVSLGARPEYGEGMASGDVVNSAARLQSAAPENGILVDETTYRATERIGDYREHAAVAAKGKVEPIVVFEAVDARSRLGVDVVQEPATGLVGREKELDVLLDALARVRSEREPQLVTLVGVPGIGKSRLVYELFRTVERDTELITWRQGRSLPYGDGVTFWALGEMLKAQAGILESDTAEETEAKLVRAVRDVVPDAEADWVERHLRTLAGVSSEPEAGGDRRSEAFAAWRRFLEALAEQGPAVLVFEDLHWADEGLLDFVDYLVDWVSGVPLLCVCTARPELLARRPGWGGGKPNAATISLSPLSDHDTARLVHALLERSVVDAELQSALLARAGGNPLYAEEFARMVAEGREAETLPETIQGIIAARLDALSGEEKQLLQDAAVFGKVFWLGAVSAMDGRERWRAETVLHGLDRKEFIRRQRASSVGGDAEFAFRHLLVRDVAYGQIPRAQRVEKHRRAAEWLESLAADRTEDHAEMLAHHYLSALEYARATALESAELVERARVSLREAGDRAFSLNSFPAAVRFYRAALESWPPDDVERARILFRYGKALYYAEGAGDDALAEARDGLLALGDPGMAAEAESALAMLAWRRGETERSSTHHARAFELVQDAPPSRSKACVLLDLARSLMIAAESEEAIRIASEVLTMAEPLGLDDMAAIALMTSGDARVELGDLGGLDQFEQGLEIARRLRTPDLIRGCVNLADTMMDLGELARAFELRAESLREAERLGSAPGIRWCRGERPGELYWLGRWDEALRLAAEFIAESEAADRHYMEAGCRQIRGQIRLAHGQLAEALADASVALDLARPAKDPQILYPALAFHARASLACGRRDAAEALAGELVALVRESEKTPTAYLWLCDLAVSLVGLGRGDELLGATARVKKRTPWLDAARAFAAGDFLGAAEKYARIEAKPEEAFSRLRAAEHFVRDGRRREGDAQLQRALSFYRSVGAAAYIRDGEALLAASA